MEFTPTGKKKSLKLMIREMGDDGSLGNIIEDGINPFTYNGVNYPQWSNDDLAKSTRSESTNDGTWDIRLNAFRGYITSKYSTNPKLLASIHWNECLIDADIVYIKIMQRPATVDLEAFAVAYHNSDYTEEIGVSMLDDITVTLSFYTGETYELIVPASVGVSEPVRLAHGLTIADASSSISPEYTDRTLYRWTVSPDIM